MEQSSSVTSLTLGAKLKQAREQQGLSVDDVAASLKLLPRIIDSLESDNYQALPEPVFIKGYVRLYAELLHLPTQECADLDVQYPTTPSFKVQTLLPVDELPELASHHPSSYLKLPHHSKNTASKLWLSVLGVALVAAMVIGVWQSMSLRGKKTEQPIVANSSVQEQNVISLPNVTTTRAVTDILKLQFSEPTKVYIKDANGTELANTTSKAGDTLTVQGESPFAIELNPAHAVQFTFNDKAIDLKPYIVNDVVNFRLSR
jgi:cytoskeleton protein RodZ